MESGPENREDLKLQAQRRIYADTHPSIITAFRELYKDQDGRYWIWDRRLHPLGLDNVWSGPFELEEVLHDEYTHSLRSPETSMVKSFRKNRDYFRAMENKDSAG